LLFFEGVDENDAKTVVFDAFDFAFIVVVDEQWIYLRNILGAETDVAQSTLFPSETNRTQPIYDIQTFIESFDIGFITQAGRAKGDESGRTIAANTLIASTYGEKAHTGKPRFGPDQFVIDVHFPLDKKITSHNAQTFVKKPSTVDTQSAAYLGVSGNFQLISRANGADANVSGGIYGYSIGRNRCTGAYAGE
jgi:hypothetical protein